MSFKLNEAIGRAEMNGKKVLKKDIAAKLWANSSPAAQGVNMNNLLNGTHKKISPEWVNIICEMLDCTPNFLFGYERD